MVLAKVAKDFYGAGDSKYRVGELMKVDVNSHLLQTGYLTEIESDTPMVACSCGRLFLLIPDSENPEQLLAAHALELGKGHKKAETREKVSA